MEEREAEKVRISTNFSVHNIETLVYRARKSLKSQLEMVGVNVWNNVNPPVSDDMEDNPGISNDIVDNELVGTPDDMDMEWAIIEWNRKNISTMEKD